MTFVTPIWLLGLLPWAGVTVWLLRARPDHTPIPFLPLWKSTPVPIATRPRLRMPPFGLAAILLAMLLGVLAAAGPAMKRRGEVAVTILVDRGLTMSAKGLARPRYIEVGEHIEARLRAHRSRVKIIDLVSGEWRETDASGIASTIALWPRTGLDTSPLLRPAVVSEVARGENRVVLISDARVDFAAPRFSQAFPSTPLNTVGIADIAVGEGGVPEVMVAVRNASSLKTAALSVSSRGATVYRRVQLPDRDSEARYFFGLAGYGDLIEARLTLDDDLEADDTASLAREARPSRLEVRSTVPDSVRRMSEAYSLAKPAVDGSPIAVVFNSLANLRPGDAGIVIEAAGASVPLNGAVVVQDHPLTRIVDWNQALRRATGKPNPTGEWETLVTIGNRVVLAKRDTPERQVWVGFESEDFPRSADFVVFWTNAFDWVGGAGDVFLSFPVGALGVEWRRHDPLPSGADAHFWPGLYRRMDGALRAMNVGRFSIPSPSRPLPETWPREISGEGEMPIGRWISLAAIVCVAIGSFAWRSSPRPNASS